MTSPPEAQTAIREPPGIIGAEAPLKPICDTILDAIGGTPMVRINRITRGIIPATVLAKLETFNPGNSIKDRMAVRMIEDAERDGRLKPGGTIIEGTSGNTGMGLAIAAVVKGYRCIFTTTDKQSPEKADALRAFGADVIVCPTNVEPEDPRSYYSVSSRLVKEVPNSWKANQYDNLSNSAAHYEQTGPEIWEQTEGRITHFVCSPGTGGTVSGVGRYLKEKNPKVQVIAGDPVGSIYSEYAKTHEKGAGSPYKVEGIGGDKIPTSLHFEVIDEWITVSDVEAFGTARRMTREEGIFLGGSGGLNVFAALEVARRLDDPAAMVVTILCDTGERYLSKLYDDHWMRENQMLEAERVTAGALLTRYPREIPPIVSVLPTASVRQALNLMSTWGVSQIPVIDGQDGVGSLSEGPLMARAIEDGKVLDRPVSEVMQHPFPVVDADVPLDRLATLLSRETPAALVRKDDRLVGILNRYDVLRQVAGIR
jgi:cystathionine beta-synthase